MSKILSLENIIKEVAEHKKNNQNVGLITGCFDVLHEGHIDLFRFAKKHVDILVVGLDDDLSIRKSKGKNRPINNIHARSIILSELRNIDYVFAIDGIFEFGNDNAAAYHRNLLKRISPQVVITSKFADKHWKDKRDMAKELGLGLVLSDEPRSNSSTSVINKIISETL